jgi:hypothetical protein
MYNSTMVSHPKTHHRPITLAPIAEVAPVAAVDYYQTRTGDETTLLKPPAAPLIPADQCAACQARGGMIPAEKAATICQCRRRTIYRWIEEGVLHFRELPDGTVLVCGATLMAKLEQLEDATGRLPC